LKTRSVAGIDRYVDTVVRSLKQRPFVTSILLIGSVSRGDYNETSDIDLVVITDVDVPMAKITRGLPKSELEERRLSILPYRKSLFRKRYLWGNLFIRHVVEEGKVLFDTGFYEELLKAPLSDSSEETRFELELVKKRLYMCNNNLKAFNNLFIDFFTRMYRLSAETAIVGVALAGKPEFNRHDAFKRFAEVYPGVRKEIKDLERLEPFSLAVTRGADVKLPFSPIGSSREARKSVSELKKVIEVVETSIS
jgi:predicted nucleotidyltransferase